MEIWLCQPEPFVHPLKIDGLLATHSIFQCRVALSHGVVVQTVNNTIADAVGEVALNRMRVFGSLGQAE